MVRFSQSLDDRQARNKEKPYEQRMENPYYVREERPPRPVQMRDDRLYSQPPQQPVRQEPAYQRQDNFYSQPSQEIDEIIYERPVIERESVKSDLS